MKIKSTIAGLAVLGLLCLVATSCASSLMYSRATSQLRSGDKVGAVLSAAASLSYDQENYKALELLDSAYPAAVAEKRAEADAALAATDDLRWERVARAWEAIHAMGDAIAALPPLYRKGEGSPVRFALAYDAALLAEARAKAAEFRYGEGRRLLALGRRAEARSAYADFQKAESFFPGYKDAAVLLGEARDLGSGRIAVLPFETSSGDSLSRSFADMVQGGCQAALLGAAAKEAFVQVVERSRIESMIAEGELSLGDLADPRRRPDAIGIYGANVMIFGKVLALSPSYPTVTARSESFVAEIERPVADAPLGAAKTEKVKRRAFVTIFAKRSSVSATVSLRAVDLETSLVVESKTVSDSMSDSCEWAVSSGDSEAVPERYRGLLAKGERDLRSPDEMMPRMAERMGEAFSKALVARLGR
jgi:curli biogenesis system outer membrane secretion channel CsgG